MAKFKNVGDIKTTSIPITGFPNVRATGKFFGTAGAGIPEYDDIIGQTEVTPQSYETNNTGDIITCGVGGTHADLVTAYNAANEGEIIDIVGAIPDLTAKLYLSKGVDVGGKSIKIRGAEIGNSTIVLHNTNPAIELATSGASIEFENIIFDNNNNVEPYRDATNNFTGFSHFINCVFDGFQSPQFYDCQELVMDGVTFQNQVDGECVRITSLSNRQAGAKAIFNNINCDYTSVSGFNNFITHLDSGATEKLDLISITNSTIGVKQKLFTGTDYEVNEVDVRGNLVTTNSSVCLPLKIGVEATLDVLDHYDVYAPATTYSIGDQVQYDGNAWQAIQETTGNAPSKTSSFWKVAETITGTIENNTFNGGTYFGSGHGIFIGFGAYDVSLKYNIVTKYWFNYVVKGYNSTIYRNCAGEGLKGFTIFANDQALIANNTSRSDIDEAFSTAQQNVGADTTDVENTTIRDNIFVSEGSSQVVFSMSDTNNLLNQNIYFGTTPSAVYDGSSYGISNPVIFDNFKTACSDTNALFVDPEFLGVDATLSDYYKPDSATIKRLRDADGLPVGAVNPFD